MSYYHLTNIQRTKIETYLESGLKPVDIAKKLGMHKSTLSRELNRCERAYSAELAQEHYEQRSKRKGRKSSFCPKLKYNIKQGLNASWSPEQIEDRYLLEQRFKTIYNWLYQGLLDCPLSTLRRKGKSRQPRER